MSTRLVFTLKAGGQVEADRLRGLDVQQMCEVVDLVEEVDDAGVVVDRYRFTNIGSRTLRRRGDTPGAWRFP